LHALACSAPPSTTAGASADAAVYTDADALIDASLLLADFSIDMGRSRVDLSIAEEEFSADSCELEEQCVAAAGTRRVLRFSVETINLGEGDLVLGPPADNPNFEWSSCHDHYHFRGYASYRLLDSDGAEVIAGRKQAFCLLDSEPYSADASQEGIYNCSNQGLQAGWADVYSADLPCQFLDITEVPDGEYELEVEVNPEGLLSDASSDNNVGSISLEIGNTELSTPTETCPDMPPRYVDRIARECDWDFVGEFDCTPGTQTAAACAQNCGMGSCTGDPMIRACDASEANCTSAVALEANDNRCSSQCPMTKNFLCPESGRLAVYTAASKLGEQYSCEVVVGPGPIAP
jgi:hypothetical protein